MTIPVRPSIGEVVRLDGRLDRLIDPNARIEVVASGFEWAEGPVWVSAGNYLLFSDIPRNSVMKWSETEGITLFLKPSGFTGTVDYGREPGSNGMTLDSEGRLVACEHGDRRISRLYKDGGKRTLVDNYMGKRLNSPNDLVFKSNGDLYFTDPPYGLPKHFEDPRRELDFCGVYRLSADGALTLLTRELTRPNGLAFSPDEKTLYVANSDPDHAVWMKYPLKSDGTLGAGQVLLDVTDAARKGMKGLPDGMKVAAGGEIFAGGPGGMYVISPQGEILGRIDTKQATANCAWGDDGATLYMTADHYLCRIRTKNARCRYAGFEITRLPPPSSDRNGDFSMSHRLGKMYGLREDAAKFFQNLGEETQTPNGDEKDFADLRGTFTKSLPHDPATGLADRTAFDALYANLSHVAPAPAAFNPFVDPQAGYAFDTEGPDAQQLSLPAAPKFDSDLEVAEIAENYWMALLRDTPYANYGTDPLALAAVEDLNKFTGFKDVTPQTLFRGPLHGEETGPYLSQFLIWDVPYGSQLTPATVAFGLPPKQDYMTTWESWLAVQNGVTQPVPPVKPYLDPRHITSGRDMSQYVHVDELFQAYLNACLILIAPAGRGGFGALADQGNPYVGANTANTPPTAKHMNQVGFGTLGEPNFKTLVAEVATRALKQVWHQKWMVHRRLRPEAWAGRLEGQRRKAVSGMVSDQHLDQIQTVLGRICDRTGTWLLPQAFPEGCPVHPAYGAGHATVAGACVTVLKALFYEKSKLSELGIEPLTIDAGGNRVCYKGADASYLTILGELNKLASNIGLSRNVAGVHWRTDYTESLVMGERIALYFLQEYINTYHERVTFHIRSFNNCDITIKKGEWQEFPRYPLPITRSNNA